MKWTREVALVCVVALAAAALGAQPKRSLNRQSTSVLPGVALPARQAVISAPIEGVLQGVLVREGEHVKKGQALAQMDDRVARAAVEAALCMTQRKAEEKHAAEALALAEKKLRRLQAIKEPGAIRAIDLEEALARRNQARASLASALEVRRQAECNLALERARLERLTVVAPFDGIVSRVKGHVGETLTNAHEILHLVSLRRLRAEMHVPMMSYHEYRVGDVYYLSAGKPIAQRVVGKIIAVDPVLNPATRTFRCVVEIDNVRSKFPAGFAVKFVGKAPRGETNRKQEKRSPGD